MGPVDQGVIAPAATRGGPAIGREAFRPTLLVVNQTLV
jgi:hypothetical protein